MLLLEDRRVNRHLNFIVATLLGITTAPLSPAAEQREGPQRSQVSPRVLRERISVNEGWRCEDPLRMGHVLEDVVGQKHRQLATALGGVRGAQLPLLARRRDEHLVLARIAVNAREARIPDAAVEVVGYGLVPRALPEAVARLEALIPGQLDGFLEGLEALEERRPTRIPRGR